MIIVLFIDDNNANMGISITTVNTIPNRIRKSEEKMLGGMAFQRWMVEGKMECRKVPARCPRVEAVQ